MAEGGLRYNRFHVTAMCSPTRAAMLTGRNHHAVGFGSIGEFSTAFPGYSALLQMGRRRAILKPRQALAAVASDPFRRCPRTDPHSLGRLLERHLRPTDTIDEQPSPTRSEPRVTVQIHPGLPRRLRFAATSIQGARMNNAPRNYS
jgi:hypothetical protein